MLHRFFSKEKYYKVDYYLEELLTMLEIEASGVDIRKEIATYANPYSLRMTGKYKEHQFILSLFRSALRNQAIQKRLELIIPCQNEDWVQLDIHPKTVEQQKKKLGMDPIPFLDKLKEVGIEVKTSNKYYVLETFDDVLVNQILDLHKQGFQTIQIERQKAYFKGHWLPNTYQKTRQLFRAFTLLMHLVQEVDK